MSKKPTKAQVAVLNEKRKNHMEQVMRACVYLGISACETMVLSDNQVTLTMPGLPPYLKLENFDAVFGHPVKARVTRDGHAFIKYRGGPKRSVIIQGLGNVDEPWVNITFTQ